MYNVKCTYMYSFTYVFIYLYVFIYIIQVHTYTYSFTYAHVNCTPAPKSAMGRGEGGRRTGARGSKRGKVIFSAHSGPARPALPESLEQFRKRFEPNGNGNFSLLVYLLKPGTSSCLMQVSSTLRKRSFSTKWSKERMHTRRKVDPPHHTHWHDTRGSQTEI